MIHYLQQHEIDKEKWDACITSAPNGLLYSHYFFLSALCRWDALVLGDYEAVLPLPHRKKMGIRYIYNPAYAAQTGITGPAVTPELALQFLQQVPPVFKLLQLNFNEFNALPEAPFFTAVQRVNYVLNLNRPYALLFDNFTKDARKNIRQAKNKQLAVKENIDIALVFDFYEKMYGQHLQGGVKKDFVQFIDVCREAILLKKGFTVGITDAEGQLVSASFWGIDNKRLYYLLGAPTALGKKTGATYFLINHIIETFSNQPLLLDFEGSDIASVADFYRQFSPEKKTYQLVTLNRLPFFLRWLK